MGNFTTRARLFRRRSLLGFVEVVVESLVKVTVWLEAACYCFLLLCSSGEPLLEAFMAMKVFSCDGSRKGFVPKCERNSVEVVVWLEAA